MSISYGFYDSNNHDRVYSARDFGTLFDGIIDDGVFTTIYNKFEVTYDGIDNDNGGLDRVKINSGKAWFNGTWFTSTSFEYLLCAQRVSGMYRRDAVAIKIDQTLANRLNSLVVITGNTAATPEGTSISMPQEEDVYYYPLAFIIVSPLGRDDITPTVIDNRGTTTGPMPCPYSGGANEDVLSIAHGGTGAVTAEIARANLGAAAIVHTHSANAIVSGVLDVDRIPNLPASRIASGVLDPDVIPNISATKITSGTLALLRGGTGVSATSLDNLLSLIGAAKANNTYTMAQVDQIVSEIQTGSIPAGNITGTVAIGKGGTGATTAAGALANLGAAHASHTHGAGDITSGTLSADRIPDLAASKITSGAFSVDRIPGLPASKITSGTFNTARIPGLPASQITSGTFDTARIPGLPASKITSGVLPLANGGTGATTAAGALDALLTSRMKLTSGIHYGSSFPNGAVTGQIFFKAV